jgi:hypothetical protein
MLYTSAGKFTILRERGGHVLSFDWHTIFAGHREDGRKFDNSITLELRTEDQHTLHKS